MNQAHLHLLFNHFPVVGTILCLLLLLAAILRKSGELKRISLAALVLIALLAIPAYLTGEPAEDVVENLPGVSKALIEPHEEAALAAIISTSVTGLFALFGLFWVRGKKSFPSWIMTAALLLTAVSVGLMAQTANLGGKIHHPEISGVSTTAPAEGGVENKDKDKKKHDDD